MTQIHTAAICPVCRDDNCQRELEYRGKHRIFVGRSLYRCTQCDLVFAWPMPEPEEWEAYNQDFFLESVGGLTAQDPANLFFEGIALVRLAQIEDFFPQGLPQSVLEVGPGPGIFCRHYLERCQGARYSVVETDTACQNILRQMGIDVNSDISDLSEDNRFDLLIMSHVLEHVADPINFLKNLTAFMNPNGLVFIEVPCTDYEYKEIFESHILFFNKESMGYVLTEAGLKDVNVGYYGELISQLRKEIGFGAKWRRRFGRLVGSGDRAKVGSRPSYMSPEIWNQVGQYEPCDEKSEPARWLRAFARVR